MLTWYVQARALIQSLLKNPIPILSFNKYLSRTYYVPSYFRHMRYTVNKTDQDPCLHGAYIIAMGEKLSIEYIHKLLRMPENAKCYDVKTQSRVRGVLGGREQIATLGRVVRGPHWKGGPSVGLEEVKERRSWPAPRVS